MNMLIPYSWLKDFLKTDLSPKEFATVVSAHGPSIEKWHQTDDGDVVFDVEVTTNRIDAFSVYGLAREAYAILKQNNIDTKLEEPQLPEIINGSGVNYEVYPDIDESLCSRFTAVVIDGVDIKPSPKHIVDRLEKVGERGINNVVDISNYVMWELGQPMHTFDYDKIVGHRIILRKAKAGESVTTLDGVRRQVPQVSIVIQDEEKLIDLAGIMGGKNSAVDENTRRVLLFVQTYNPHVIRKTTMQMGFRSEAASRFEKGLDPENVMPALKRATDLFLEHTGGVVASDVIDLYPTPYEPKTVSVLLQKINTLIGQEISADAAKTILDTLGFSTVIKENPHPTSPSVEGEEYGVSSPMKGEGALSSVSSLFERGADEGARLQAMRPSGSIVKTGVDRSKEGDDIIIEVTVPSYRADDIAIPEDLVEEIARMHGYHNIPSVLPAGQIPNREENFVSKRVAQAKTHLKYLGFTELYTNSATSIENIRKVGYEENAVVTIINPLTEDFVAMRPLLLATILPAVAENLPRFPELNVFELSKVYVPQKKGLPQERRMLQLITTDTNLLKLKGVIESIFEISHIGGVTTKPNDSSPRYQPGTSAYFFHNKNEIGHIGLLANEVAQSFGIQQPLAIAKLHFDYVIDQASDVVQVKPIPKYPAFVEDISITVHAGQPVGPLIEAVKKIDKLITNVKLIDTYYFDRVGLSREAAPGAAKREEDKKSLTFRITYQSPTKLLSDKDVVSITNKIKLTTQGLTLSYHPELPFIKK